MIESTLIIIVVCDGCGYSYETDTLLDAARRPDINAFESRAIHACIDDGWTVPHGKHLCPHCSHEAKAA